MSVSHQIAYRMLMKHKVHYDAASPPDYLARQRKEAAAKPRAIPRDVQCSPISVGGIKAEALSCPANPKGVILLYIHGGGFVGGSAQSRRDIALYLVRKMGFNVVSIDYRLAPTHPFPAAPQDCFAAYRVLEEQYGGTHIALVGESAGGNLVLSVVLQAQDAGIPLPACVVSISPIVQYDQAFSSHTENQESDCMISNLQQELMDAYLQSMDASVLRNPYAAPLHGNSASFPPTYLIASESEVLRDDAIHFHDKLTAAGRESTLRLYPGLMHAFPIITAFPESRSALDEVGRFFQKHLQGAV